MKKTILLLFICTGLITTIPFTAKALKSQLVDQNLHQNTSSLLAQYQQQRYITYVVQYRATNDNRRWKWLTHGSFATLEEAQRVEYDLQTQGLDTRIQISR
jgi:cell division protein FtsN